MGQSNRVTGLLVAWNPDGAGPAHERLAAALRAQVNGGRLRPGDRLPPSRVLAEELGVSRWVITEAYDQLKAEGYLGGRVGSGTVVVGASVDRPVQPVPARVDHPVHPVPDETIDLSPALPDLTSFPRAGWRAALGRALAVVSDHDLGYPDPAGAPQLRATMAGYLRRVRGLEVDADRVQVTQGVRHAMALVCRALRAQGAVRVAVEDPSWPQVRDIAVHAGLDVVPIGVDGHGMRVEQLAEHAVDAVFVTPTHQFPTGVPLSATRRLALIDWAARGDRLVIEDDYDAEFRYDRRPVGALAARSAEHVVYLGSTSKTLSPALHLGWMVVPARFERALARARDGIGALAPTIDQVALVTLIASGGYDRHLRRMRRTYHQRRLAMLAALRSGLAGAPSASMDAGLHVLWYLPDDADEAGLLATSRRRGLSLLGLSQCRVSAGPPGLVLGYGNVPEHRAGQVVAVLAAALGAP